MLTLALLAACTSTLSVGRPDKRGDSGTTDTGEPSDSGETGDTVDTVDTGDPPDVDCSAVGPVLEDNELDGPRAYHDVEFDSDGRVIGWDGSSLVTSTYDGQRGVLIPNVSSAQGMERLPDGDLVYLNDVSGDLIRVSDDGGSSVIASGFYGGYGVTIGPDEAVYVGATSAIQRVDPSTGSTTEYLRVPNGITPRIIQWNLDSTRVYVATVGNGTVYTQEVDEALQPLGRAEVFASGIGSWHDGLGVDACGNVYVAEFVTRAMYRVDPDGNVTHIAPNGWKEYGHGLAWGSGVGGWRTDAIYVPQPYDRYTVREIVLGVPSASTYRTWAGG